jgi:hypothetical protein
VVESPPAAIGIAQDVARDRRRSLQACARKVVSADAEGSGRLDEQPVARNRDHRGLPSPGLEVFQLDAEPHPRDEPTMAVQKTAKNAIAQVSGVPRTRLMRTK